MSELPTHTFGPIPAKVASLCAISSRKTANFTFQRSGHVEDPAQTTTVTLCTSANHYRCIVKNIDCTREGGTPKSPKIEHVLKMFDFPDYFLFVVLPFQTYHWNLCMNLKLPSCVDITESLQPFLSGWWWGQKQRIAHNPVSKRMSGNFENIMRRNKAHASCNKTYITTTFLLRIRHNYTRLFEQSHACKAVVRNFPPPPPPPTTTTTTPPGYWGHDVSAVGSAACSEAADPLPTRSWDSSLSGTLQPTPSPVAIYTGP